MPTITTRSVIAKTRVLMITLPKPWSDFYHLQKGNALKVYININGNLHLSLNPNSQDRSVRLVYLGGLLTVSLPAEWVQLHNLKKGDKVEVIANGELLIRPAKGSR